MSTRLKFFTVASILWLLIAITIAADASYRASDFAVSVMVSSVIPLVVIWGGAWIFSGRKRSSGIEEKKPKPSSVLDEVFQKVLHFTWYLFAFLGSAVAIVLVGWILYEAWRTYGR